MERRFAMAASAALCLTIALQLVAPSTASSDPGEGSVVRIIELAASPTCPACNGGPSSKDASARVTFHSWGQWGDGFMFNVDGLVWVPDSWALYLVEGTIETGTILGRWTFNVYPWGTTGRQTFGVGVWPEFPLKAPVLTAFVAYEADDGRWFDRNTDMAWVALLGTSTLP